MVTEPKPTVEIMDAIQRLSAWNEGDTDAIPPGYDHDSLDWQRDIRSVLKIVRRVIEIADDFIPDNDAYAPLALQEMRGALKALVE